NIELITGGKGKKILLFLHGIGSVPHAYSKLYKQLSAKYYIVAPSLPGHGNTNLKENFIVKDSNKTLANYVEFLEILVEEMEIESPITLMGHSLGGAIAVKFAAKNKNKVDHLILIDSTFESLD